MRKLIISALLGVFLISCSSQINTREQALKNAEEATEPYFDMTYASNASIPGRICMNYKTSKGIIPRPCINTVTSFYNKNNTCSSCKDFVKNPHNWGFKETNTPQKGDIVIYFRGDSAYHAAIITKVNPIRVNHAVKANYLKGNKLPKNNIFQYYTLENE